MSLFCRNFPRLHLRVFAIFALVGVSAGEAKPIQYAGLTASPAAVTNRHALRDDSAAVPGAIQFENIPAPLPTSIDAVNFAQSGTTEIGDLVQLHGASHFLGRVTVVKSSTARHEDYPAASPLGFSHPVTLSVYDVDRPTVNPRPGALLARVTETFLIPWQRGDASTSYDMNRAFLLNFDLSPLGLALPGEVIVAIAVNTQFHGRAPVLRPGPHDELGLALTREAPAIGADLSPDALYWHSTQTGNMGLTHDAGWGAFSPAIRVHDSAYGVLFETLVRLESLRGPNLDAAAGVNFAASLLRFALDREFWDGNAQLAPAGGGQVFELLADAADALSLVAGAPGSIAAEARHALDSLSRVTSFIAETTLADAMIFGGDTEALLRAQSAADLAVESKGTANHGAAIAAYGAAWEEAQGSLR